ncbi:type VI secretion system-associated protein TagF [Ningiella sp. W23]|uniref:type VI secretion system-associated protein TagF n=1 Tax=Ningiella sp. W23 TaxID=3023715 RepID=UPI003756AB33
MAAYYGKVPGKGDFVSKDMPREISEQIHHFFADGLKSASNEIGPEWLDNYAITPLWYFYLQPGIIDEHAWIGMWMPSVDRVNRHFPFIVMQHLSSPIQTISELGHFQNSMFEMEDFLLDMLEPDAELEPILEKIATLTLFSNPNAAATIDAYLNHQHDMVESAPQPQTEFEVHLLDKVNTLEEQLSALQTQVADLLATEQTVDKPVTPSLEGISTNLNLAARYCSAQKLSIIDTLEEHSIWMSAGNAQMRPQLIVHSGLPDAELFNQFLVGI